MPIHDWARVDADLFHHFHRCWTAAICDTLNRGSLPTHFSALLEPRTPDRSLNIQSKPGDRVVIRNHLRGAVCVIEVVSPGNKHNKRAFEAFVGTAVEFLRNGIHLLIVDLFPPTVHDPGGLPAVIWDQFGESFEPVPEKLLTLAAFVASGLDDRPGPAMFMEPIAVGDFLPDMPAFVEGDSHVPVPLEPTYQAAWASCPPSVRELVETGRLADEGE